MVGAGHAAQIDGDESGFFIPAQELGFGHAAVDGVGRIVEREFVAQAPSKDTAAQQHEPEGQTAQAFAATEDKALGLPC